MFAQEVPIETIATSHFLNLTKSNAEHVHHDETPGAQALARKARGDPAGLDEMQEVHDKMLQCEDLE